MEDVTTGGLFDVSRGFFEFRCVPGANGDSRAFTYELFGNGAAKSFAGGRDDGHAAL
jgi:hypothetical protein